PWPARRLHTTGTRVRGGIGGGGGPLPRPVGGERPPRTGGGGGFSAHRARRRAPQPTPPPQAGRGSRAEPVARASIKQIRRAHVDLGLAGKKAIVTGGTRGIGRAIADLLVEEGCDGGIYARNQAQV